LGESLLHFQIPNFYEHVHNLASERGLEALFDDEIKPFLDDTVETDKPKAHFFGLTWHETLMKLYQAFPMLKEKVNREKQSKAKFSREFRAYGQFIRTNTQIQKTRVGDKLVIVSKTPETIRVKVRAVSLGVHVEEEKIQNAGSRDFTKLSRQHNANHTLFFGCQLCKEKSLYLFVP
jgi:hypothetical protein